MQSLLQVQWLVKPLKPPRLWLSCARCGTKRAFVCSGKFRVNAQKRRMDAWLIYRCSHCDQTWNLPVVERCPVQAIAPALLHRLMGNERALVQRYAFDLALLRGYAQQIESFADLSVEKSMKATPSAHPEGAEIEFLVPFECGCRLDKLLAGELVISRSAVTHFIEMKAMTVTPASLRAWNQTVHHGQRVTVNLRALPDTGNLLTRIAGN